MNRRLKLALLMFLLAPASTAHASALIERRIKWHKGDPVKHFIGGTAGTLALAEFLKWRGYAPWKATLSSIIVGTAACTIKEFGHDRSPSANDLFWGGAGVAVGTGIQFTFRF